MYNSLVVSSSPHIKDKNTVSKIMQKVAISLLPASIFGIYSFGVKAALIIAICILSSCIFDYLCIKLFKRTTSIYDFSAVVTGLLLALNLPPAVPLWMPVAGSFIAIVLVKQLFGGLGQNFMNPALAARVILLISWPTHMTNWVNPASPDSMSSATPLAFVGNSDFAKLTSFARPAYRDLFIGNISGCIGEISAAALLTGAAYLVLSGVISLHIPLSFIGSFAIMIWLFGGDTIFKGDVLYHVLAGGLVLGAFFMATDYSTSPVTHKGKIIMGIGCGILTALIRLYSPYPEGVSFAIIFMNTLVPLIDRYCIPSSFGGAKKNVRRS